MPDLRRSIRLDTYAAALELVRELLFLAEETDQEPNIQLEGATVFVLNRAPRQSNRMWPFEQFSQGLDELIASPPKTP